MPPAAKFHSKVLVIETGYAGEVPNQVNVAIMAAISFGLGFLSAEAKSANPYVGRNLTYKRSHSTHQDNAK